MKGQKVRIMFVHGACHGAWCWHKVVKALISDGHSAVALDLAASGFDKRRMIDDVSTFEEFTQPLMEAVAALPAGEKAVLVGHSLGGLSLALAMETFPTKIALAIFVTAVMPNTCHSPASVFDKFAEYSSASVYWKDTEIKEVRVHGRDEPFTTMLFGPQFMEDCLYQLCTPEDLGVAKSLVRIGSLFQEDVKRMPLLSKQRYGSVDKVYIVCGEDAAMTEEYQRWMISKNVVKKVIVIDDADHMVMLSRPNELCKHLTDIIVENVTKNPSAAPPEASAATPGYPSQGKIVP